MVRHETAGLPEEAPPPMMRLTLSLAGDPDRAAAERAVAELRAGRPVLVEADGASGVAVGVEAVDPVAAARLDAAALGGARLVLAAGRLRRLGLDRTEPGAVALPVVDPARIEALALQVEARIDAPVRPLETLDRAALELARLATLLPALVVVPVSPGIEMDPAVLRVTAAAVEAFARAKDREVRLVSRAPVPLEGAPDTEFVVFRGGEGLRDQVAVVVGRPDLAKPVTVRLHSACLTGDLFGSLKCDCGDQLRDTVRGMASRDGGILLYLDQEGRGSGIANKIRAYRLQAQGFDTYEADEVLGFGLDGRRFAFAAEMLRQLGVTRVRLMTNNPDKIAALRDAGLDVAAHERVVGRTTPENLRYLAAKRDRAGHLLGGE